MTVKELKEILNQLEDKAPLTFVVNKDDDVTSDCYDIGEARLTTRFIGDKTTSCLCLLPL